MIKQPFQDVWNLILKNEGETFFQKRGGEFTYKIKNDKLNTSKTDYPLTKNNFAAAYDLCPFTGPGEITNTIRGSSYVWAILHDKRITNFNNKTIVS